MSDTNYLTVVLGAILLVVIGVAAGAFIEQRKELKRWLQTLPIGRR
jgi:uncharacterized protein YneF (UPF0154 family)